MGRLLINKPQVFPCGRLSILDAAVSTRTRIASLQRRLSVTTVMRHPARPGNLTIGGRIAVLAGLLSGYGTRRRWRASASEFVAGFIGSPR